MVVDSKVKLRSRLLVVDGMEALENHDFVGLNQLWRVLVAGVMVVDGLVNCLSLLEGLNLGTHQSKVVLPRIQCCQSCGLPTCTVIRVVVIKANNCHHVAYGS